MGVHDRDYQRPREFEPDDEGPEGEEEDHDLPDESDMDDDDEPDIVPCPHCRKAISEDADRCHHCGQYITSEDAPVTLSTWMTILICLLLALIALGWIFWF